MSISQNFPNLKPSLLLDFQNTKALDSRVTFSRASSATYYGTETAKAEENLLLRSQELDNEVWVKFASTITANAETAPDGTLTAETWTISATTAQHYVQQASTYTIGLQYTISVFVKKNTIDFIQVVLTGGRFSTNAYANFNINTGVLGTVGADAIATITSVGNGYYRCSVTGTATSTGGGSSFFAFIESATDARFPSYAGNGTDSVFLWGAQLEQRDAVTAYTPTTDQPITRFQPVLELEPAGVARFDHDPLTFESLGLLVEEQRTNLLLRSEEFDNAGWSKTRSSITANTIIAPDGTLSGDKLVEDTSLTTTHFTQQLGVGTIIAGATVTYSIFVKSGERTDCSLLVTGASFGDRFEAIFNLVTGVVRSTNAAGTGSVAGATINPVGNEWYRLTVTGVSGSANTTCAPRIQTANSFGNTSYTGNGFSGIFIWGAQLE